MRALMVVMGRKKALRMLRVMAEGFATEQDMASVLPVRPARDAVEVGRVRREAAEAYMRYTPVFAAAIPME